MEQDHHYLNLFAGALAALVVTVTTPAGELELGIHGQRVTAALDKSPLPEDRVVREGSIVTVRGQGDGVLARLDFSPARDAYAVTGDPKRYRIGITTKEPEAALAEQLGIDPESTVVVTDVQAGMPAAEAGLRRHDVIVAINGSPPSTQARLTEVLDGMKAGETLTLRVLRRSERQDLRIEPRLVAEPSSTLASRYAMDWRSAAQNAPNGADHLRSYAFDRGGYDATALADAYDRLLVRRPRADNDPAVADEAAAERKSLLEQLDRLKLQLGRVEELLREAGKRK